MNFLLAILSASAHSVGSVSLRLYQTKLQKNVADLRLFQGLAMLVAAVCYFGLNGFSWRWRKKVFFSPCVTAWIWF